MAAILEFLSAPFFHKPISPDPYATHWVVGIPYKLHTMTGSLLFLFSCFVFARELVNDHIHCIQDGADSQGAKIGEAAFNSYCYISDTFTLPKFTMDDFDAPHPGIGPIGYKGPQHEAMYHNYYMWVPYLLMFQSASFFLPLLLHRFAQEGRVQLLLAGLHNLIAFDEIRGDKYGDIKLYFRDFWNGHDWWAYKLFFCDALNLVNVICNLFFTNWYLSRQFFSYGISSLQYMTTSPEERGMDPFNLIFPKMTKCTFNTYGPSGSLQNYDGLCVLPINVLNEKIYLVTWFVLFALALFTAIYSLVAVFILSVPHVRYQFLCIYLSPKRKALRKKLCRILDLTSIGDWLMLYMLAKNLTRVTFSEVIDNVKYPDYNFEVDEADPENAELEKLHEISSLKDA